MAREVNYTADDHIFIGEDKEIPMTVWDDSDPDAPVPIDVSTWALEWILRKGDTTIDPALIAKTTGAGITVTGIFSSDPLVNTQIVVVRLDDTDTASADGTSVVLKPNTYRHSLKRTDDTLETILAFGDFELLEATSR